MSFRLWPSILKTEIISPSRFKFTIPMSPAIIISLSLANKTQLGIKFSSITSSKPINNLLSNMSTQYGVPSYKKSPP